MKSWLLGQGEVEGALLSGSGSTMLAILRDDASGYELRARVRERYGENGWTFLGRTT